MEQKIGLKPCPFCGSNDIEMFASVKETENGYSTNGRAIECKKCGLIVGNPYYSDDYLVADAWNRRADIQNLSAADVQEAKHRKWVDYEHSTNAIQCSACNNIFDSSMYGYAFCPLCGARMDGKENTADEHVT